MELNNTSVYNFEGAFRGMRAPMNSWDKCDSIFTDNKIVIGDNDLRLAQKLIQAGSEHAKFMRQIFISVDITAPLYWWKEMDTYKIATVSNSTSTMHKLASKPISEKDFSFDENWDLSFAIAKDSIIKNCEEMRKSFIATKDKRYWRALIQLLPESYNQTRTWTANYATLRNIYFQRKDHKLSEWHEFCNWIESLPYSNELITLN